VRGYHVLNLAIHILAGMTLFGIVRRTWKKWARERKIRTGEAGRPPWVSPVALVWTVHPLQTESVTCIIQRTESMMGLFYLLTLYCFIRYVEPVEGSRRDRWARRSASAGPAVPPYLCELTRG